MKETMADVWNEITPQEKECLCMLANCYLPRKNIHLGSLALLSLKDLVSVLNLVFRDQQYWRTYGESVHLSIMGKILSLNAQQLWDLAVKLDYEFYTHTPDPTESGPPVKFFKS